MSPKAPPNDRNRPSKSKRKHAGNHHGSSSWKPPLSCPHARIVKRITLAAIVGRLSALYMRHGGKYFSRWSHMLARRPVCNPTAADFTIGGSGRVATLYMRDGGKNIFIPIDYRDDIPDSNGTAGGD